MSFIKNSTGCFKSELDVFLTNPTNTSILKSNVTIYPTHTPLDGNEDQFIIEVPPNSEYIDPAGIFLEIDVKIPAINAKLKTPDPSDDKIINESAYEISVINNFAQSLFRMIELAVGTGLKKYTIEAENFYPYMSYLSNLLNCPEDIKKSWLRLGMWEADTPGKWADFTDNEGFKKRLEIFTNKGTKDTCKFIIPLNLSFLQSNRLLLSRFGLTFTFKATDDKFLLMGKHYERFHVKIMKAKLHVRRCSINPSIISAHQNVLQNSPAKYPIKQQKIFVSPIEKGRREFTPPTFLQAFPTQLVVCMVRDSAFIGDKHSPWNFEHFNLSKITLTHDSTEIVQHINPTKMDCVEAYHNLQQSLNLYNKGSNGITQEDFLGGSAVYIFNLDPDKGCEEQFNQVKTGNLSLKLEFDTDTPELIRMICYMTFDNQLNLDNEGNAYYDYHLN